MENKIDIKSDFMLVRNVIINLIGVDVFDRKRLRDNVEARLIYAKILYDVGHTYKGLGRYLNKDHSTVIYYVRQFEDIYVTSKTFRDKYLKVKTFLKESNDINFVKHVTREEYKAQVQFYEKQVDILSTTVSRLNKVEERYTRFDEIIQLMEAKLPVGDEVFLLKKLNSILNSDLKDNTI